MTIIPAIDIIDGKCVRLSQGDYTKQTVYSDDPVRVAKEFEDAGFRRLHLVDLDGAKAGEVKNWKILERIASKTKLIIDFSGGIRKQDDIELSISSGAFYISLGTVAATNEALVLDWFRAFNPKRFIICADVNKASVAINGWTGKSDRTVFDMIQFYSKNGVEQFLCTDVAMDGMMMGPSFELYKNILVEYPSIHLIASGGVSNVEDLNRLKAMGCSAAIVGKAIYENKINLKEQSMLSI